MSKKAARRKTTKKPPALPAKPLRDLGGEVLRRVPVRPEVGGMFSRKPLKPRTEIGGVPLPPDLETAVRYYAGKHFETAENLIGMPPWEPFENESSEDYPDWKPAVLDPHDWFVVRRCLEDSFRQGFYLAVLRYADDLKNVPEAVRMIAGLGRGRKRGAAVRRKQAEPKRMEHRKRFRELRKQGFTKTQARDVLHDETGISVRQLERDTQGLN